MADRHAPQPTSLSHICENLGVAELDEADEVIGYTKSQYCLAHLEFLLVLLQRRDRYSKEVLIKLRLWSIALRHLIPIIRTYPQDRPLVVASVNLMSLLTKPVKKPSVEHKEYLSVVVSKLAPVLPLILPHLEETLDLTQGKWELKDDWDFVQSVLLVIGNMLCDEQFCILHNIPRDDEKFVGLSENFLDKIFVDDLMYEIMVVTHHIDRLNLEGSTEIFEIRNSTFYKVVKFAMAFKTSQDNSGPLLPFGKEIMQPMLVPACAAASVAISGFSVLAAKLVANTAVHRSYSDSLSTARWALTAAPYFYVPIGILGIAFSAGAATNDALVGFTSGWLLAQFLILIFLASLISFIKTSIDGWFLSYGTLLTFYMFMHGWGYVCGYPKCVSYLAYGQYGPCGAFECCFAFYVRRRAAAARRADSAEKAATAERAAAAGRPLAGRVAKGESDVEMAKVL